MIVRQVPLKSLTLRAPMEMFRGHAFEDWTNSGYSAGCDGPKSPTTNSQPRQRRATTSQCFDAYSRTGEDVRGPAMFCREDLVGHVAVDARALAAGKNEVVYMFISENNRRASECTPVMLHRCPATNASKTTP